MVIELKSALTELDPCNASPPRCAGVTAERNRLCCEFIARPGEALDVIFTLVAAPCHDLGSSAERQ